MPKSFPFAPYYRKNKHVKVRVMLRVFTVALICLQTAVVAYADKPNPFDCPCFDPHLLNVLALTECVATTSLIRENIGKKEYQKQFSWVQTSQRFCGTFRIKSYENSRYSSCTVIGGYDTSGQCKLSQALAHETNLANREIKACEAALREAIKEIDSLPSC